MRDDGVDFPLGGRGQHAFLPCRDLQRLGQLLAQQLGLGGEGIRLARQGQHHQAALLAGRELQERHQEGHGLVSQVGFARRGRHGHRRAQVAGDLVNHDQRRTVTDQSFEQVGAHCRLQLLAFGNLSVGGRPAELVGQLAPQRQGLRAVGGMANADRRVEIGADHAGDLDLAWLWQSDGCRRASQQSGRPARCRWPRGRARSGCGSCRRRRQSPGG